MQEGQVCFEQVFSNNIEFDTHRMGTKDSNDIDDVSDEGSIASLETSSSSSSSAAIDLPADWEVAIADDKGRLYYIDNEKKVTSWCPPTKSWKCCYGLPCGWEIAIDSKHFLYYINHSSLLTTYKHPNYDNKQFESLHQAFQAKRRKVCIKRSLRDGFGFVAGSEKPVIIRSVVAGSPADGQLSANDQLFSINGQISYNLPQPQVISMIRSCTDVLEMEVIATEDIQDVRNQGSLKSALMSRATRERRKSCPVSVRFEEKPEVLSISTPSVLSVNIIKQMIPNVLKIYLENGQTKSFQYSTETTVKEIFESLLDRLQIKAWRHFALVMIGPYRNQTIFLQPEDKVTQIVNKKVFSRWECRLELCFIPDDAYELLNEDPVAFDYWYQQTCNSVVKGHFGLDLKFDAVMRLAALQIHTAMTVENEEAKFTLKDVSKEYGGLDDFLPIGIVQNFKKKDIKKSLSSQLKSLSRIAFPGQKLTPLQAKLHYLKIASQNITFGGKIFAANLFNHNSGSDSSTDMSMDVSDVLIGPSKGICTLFTDTGNVLQHLADFADVTGIVVTSHLLNKHHLKIFIQGKKAISFIVSPQDADDMAFFIERYYKIKTEEAPDLPIYNLSQTVPRYKAPKDTRAPNYLGEHAVVPSTWSYLEDVIPTLWLNNSSVDQSSPRSISTKVDLASGPPQYNAGKSYDRSSFAPFRPKPAVDSFIRELSIRNKKKKPVDQRNMKEEQSPIKTVGHFDTTLFGKDSSPQSRLSDTSETLEEASPQLTRHIITCSMSSDEESSDDEELSDLAKKINRSGTVAKFLKNKEKNKRNGDTIDGQFDHNEDEEDSGWRTDTSSNTGSLGRSNPWGTFSEEDFSDKDSSKLFTDSESVLSHKDELSDSENQEQNHNYRVNSDILTTQLHKLDTIEESGSFTTKSDKPSLIRENSHSLDKYLVNKLDALEKAEDSPLRDLPSDNDERPVPLLRPLSQISDEVFDSESPVDAGNGVEDSKGLDSSPLSLSPEPSLDKFRAISDSPIPQPEWEVDEFDISTDAHSNEDRPQSINLDDLNIYIPAPPKNTTRAISPRELVIPSPPHDFAGDTEALFDYEGESSEFKVYLQESPESKSSSTRSSSSEEVIEFMHSEDATDESTAKEGRISPPSESPDEEVEFMTPDKITNVRIYQNDINDSAKEELKENVVKKENICECDVEPSRRTKEKFNSLPILRKSHSVNESDCSSFSTSAIAEEGEIKYPGVRRQTEPLVLPLILPKSPSLELKNERVASPVFFSLQNIPSDSNPGPFQQFATSTNLEKTDRLILPSTPLSLRRNQFTTLCSADNIAKTHSLPNSFSFNEFNGYMDECKDSISKCEQFEEELCALIEENKRADRKSFEGDDPERGSFIEVMRTGARSLLNRTKDLVTMATSGNIKGLHIFVRSSKHEIENLVVAMTTVKNSVTLATLIKDVVVGYKEVISHLKKGTGKPLTDPEIVKLMEKTNELSFSSNILVRGLRSY
ncbi:uncharacterized protein LOC135686094 isoform X2 [Rhopilema esculentum]|uniref:uncharacterized protein LOC135686094 isoform X2 n=1 Tax=Rhopilema esculentum TaxID=499914 RepID=UPI0031DB6D21